jgi:hypothetical protein
VARIAKSSMTHVARLCRTSIIRRLFKRLLVGAAVFGGMWFFYAFTPADNLARLKQLSTTQAQKGFEQ